MAGVVTDLKLLISIASPVNDKLISPTRAICIVRSDVQFCTWGCCADPDVAAMQAAAVSPWQYARSAPISIFLSKDGLL